jgi:predicted nicotinamide N-methyase
MDPGLTDPGLEGDEGGLGRHPEVWARWTLAVVQGTGGSSAYASRVWPCALALSAYLERACQGRDTGHPNPVRGRHILELGAGLAVPSLVCAARLGAASITVTDGTADYATFAQALRGNLARNAAVLRGPTKTPVHFQPLDFRDPAPLYPARPIDLILVGRG